MRAIAFPVLHDLLRAGLEGGYLCPSPNQTRRLDQCIDAYAAVEKGATDLYRRTFGEHIPLIRRQEVKGFVERKSGWLLRPLGLQKVRAQAELMKAESRPFYVKAARHSSDAATRQLLGDLAAEERRHEREGGAPRIAICDGGGGQGGA